MGHCDVMLVPLGCDRLNVWPFQTTASLADCAAITAAFYGDISRTHHQPSTFHWLTSTSLAQRNQVTTPNGNCDAMPVQSLFSPLALSTWMAVLDYNAHSDHETRQGWPSTINAIATLLTSMWANPCWVRMPFSNQIMIAETQLQHGQLSTMPKLNPLQIVSPTPSSTQDVSLPVTSAQTLTCVDVSKANFSSKATIALVGIKRLALLHNLEGFSSQSLRNTSNETPQGSRTRLSLVSCVMIKTTEPTLQSGINWSASSQAAEQEALNPSDMWSLGNSSALDSWDPSDTIQTIPWQLGIEEEWLSASWTLATTNSQYSAMTQSTKNPSRSAALESSCATAVPANCEDPTQATQPLIVMQSSTGAISQSAVMQEPSCEGSAIQKLQIAAAIWSVQRELGIQWPQSTIFVSPTYKAASASADIEALACLNNGFISLWNGDCPMTSKNPSNSMLASFMQPLCDLDKAPFIHASVAQGTRASSTQIVLACSHHLRSSTSQLVIAPISFQWLNHCL